jgi:hypothetical protein
MFLQGSWVDLQGQLRHSPPFLGVCVKLINDPWIDHLQDHPMRRNPNTLAHVLGASHSQSGVAIRHVIRKLQSSSDFQVKGARTYLFEWRLRRPTGSFWRSASIVTRAMPCACLIPAEPRDEDIYSGNTFRQYIQAIYHGGIGKGDGIPIVETRNWDPRTKTQDQNKSLRPKTHDLRPKHIIGTQDSRPRPKHFIGTQDPRPKTQDQNLSSGPKTTSCTKPGAQTCSECRSLAEIPAENYCRHVVPLRRHCLQ